MLSVFVNSFTKNKNSPLFFSPWFHQIHSTHANKQNQDWQHNLLGGDNKWTLTLTWHSNKKTWFHHICFWFLHFAASYLQYTVVAYYYTCQSTQAHQKNIHQSFPFFGARKTAQRKTADRAEKKRAREREPTYGRDKECIASHQIHRSLAYDKKAAERKWWSLTFHLTFCLHFFISSWTGVRPGDWGGGDRGKIHLN